MAKKNKTKTDATDARSPQDAADDEYDPSLPIHDSEVMPMLSPEDAVDVHDASRAAEAADEDVVVLVRLPRPLFARLDEAARHRAASTGRACTVGEVIRDFIHRHWGAQHGD